MSKKDKAYQAAAASLAHRGGYDTTLDDEHLARRLWETVTKYEEAWDIIWKAARKAEWVHSQRDQEALQGKLQDLDRRFQQERLINVTQDNDLELMAETAMNRLTRIREVEERNKVLGQTNATLLAENQRLKKELTEAKLGGRLYDQVEKENRYHENALLLAEQELDRLREQLASVRTTLDTCTKKRNELLVRAVEAEAKLGKLEATPLPKTPTKPEGEGWHLSWVKMTGETITGPVTVTGPSTFWSCATRSGEHRCTAQGAHATFHKCHCGFYWS